MFTNLIESASHSKEFKRRSSFFLITVAAYAVILFAAGIASVYAYDAQLEAQTSSLELLNWVPPIVPATAPPRDVRPIIRRTAPSTAPVDPNVTRPERTQFVSTTNDPTKVPDKIAVNGDGIPPIRPGAVLSNRNVDPPSVAPTTPGTCVTCNTSPPIVRVEETPPTPVPIKPTTARVPSTVLISKAISLPQPPYPAIARQTRIQGTVNVQILVDEQGKVISAQVVSGHPFLTTAARDAALRARFSPTILNGQTVKIQGVITYNFVMQ